MNNDLPDLLRKRAKEYEAPYRGDRTAFIESKTSYAIATVMLELASMIDSLQKGDKNP